MQKLHREVIRSLAAVRTEAPPERLLLTGGGSLIEGVAEALAERFGLPVERLDILEHVNAKDRGPDPAYAGAALAPAIGCALRMLGRNPLGIELLQDEFAPRNTFDVIRTALATVLTLGFLAVAVMTWSAKQELTAERVKFGDRHAIAKHVFKGAEGMYLQQVDAQTEVAAKQNVDRWLARGEGDPTAIRRIQRQLNRRLDYLKDQMGLSERIPPLPSALEVMTAIYKAFESVPRDELGYLRIERMTIRPRQVQMSILAETTTTFDRVRELLANAPLIVERARNPRSPVEQGSLIREGEYMKQDYTIDFREDD